MRKRLAIGRLRAERAREALAQAERQHDLAQQQVHSREARIDIVDYPGEWLLDLELLRLDYASWSAAAGPKG